MPSAFQSSSELSGTWIQEAKYAGLTHGSQRIEPAAVSMWKPACPMLVIFTIWAFQVSRWRDAYVNCPEYRVRWRQTGPSVTPGADVTGHTHRRVRLRMVYRMVTARPIRAHLVKPVVMEPLYGTVITAARLLWLAEGLKFGVSGVGNVPKTGPGVVAVNHTGYMEFHLRRYPRLCRGVARCGSWPRKRSSTTRSPDR